MVCIVVVVVCLCGVECVYLVCDVGYFGYVEWMFE